MFGRLGKDDGTFSVVAQANSFFCFLKKYLTDLLYFTSMVTEMPVTDEWRDVDLILYIDCYSFLYQVYSGQRTFHDSAKYDINTGSVA